MRVGKNLLSFGYYISSFILIIFAYRINGLMNPSRTVILSKNNKITKLNPATIMGTTNRR